MTPHAMAQALIRQAHHKGRHADVAFVATATGLPEDVVSSIAASEPGRPAAAPTAAPPPVVVPPTGGPTGDHIVASMHHIRQNDGHLLVFIGCVCGSMLRARVAELPRHWDRHRAGLA